ncbi:MAG: hypothetical protein AAF403_08185, partial [Pseudomonadota bacterium]
DKNPDMRREFENPIIEDKAIDLILEHANVNVEELDLKAFEEVEKNADQPASKEASERPAKKAKTAKKTPKKATKKTTNEKTTEKP